MSSNASPNLDALGDALPRPPARKGSQPPVGLARPSPGQRGVPGDPPLKRMPHILIAGTHGLGLGRMDMHPPFPLLLARACDQARIYLVDLKCIQLEGLPVDPRPPLRPPVLKPQQAALLGDDVVGEMEQPASHQRHVAFRARKPAYMIGAALPRRYGHAATCSYAFAAELANHGPPRPMHAGHPLLGSRRSYAPCTLTSRSTQWLSAHVITGTTKAQRPSRIAFAVSSCTHLRGDPGLDSWSRGRRPPGQMALESRWTYRSLDRLQGGVATR